jgi:DNA-binding XRE family transcriptional regulator
MARDERLGQREAKESTSTSAHSSINGHVPHIDARFGARVRDLRKERRWTQLYMAIHFGIDRSHISDVERGRKSMTLSLVEVVALGFGISVSKLLERL